MMIILHSIIESATRQNPNLLSLESIKKKVQEVLQSKMYFLVPDDVWNEDHVKWSKFKFLLQCGNTRKGSSILVTARLEIVASIMGTHPSHHLVGLYDDSIWSLFKHAFEPNGGSVRRACRNRQGDSEKMCGFTSCCKSFGKPFVL